MLEDVYALSPLQKGLYYHWLSAPDSPVYFMQTSYRLKGKLKPDVLEKSYAALVARHAVLRTFFTQDFGDQLLQVVRKDIAPAFMYFDVAEGSLSDVEYYRAADKAKGFDLHKGSQMRLTVLGLGDDVFEFIWSFHHILMDGWCGSILIREFFQIYNSLLEGNQPHLSKVYPYSNYIKWLSNIDEKKSINYWKNYLSGYDTACHLPHKTNTGKQPYQAKTNAFFIDASIRKAIKDLCIATGVTENTFVQVVWGMLLARYNNTDDAVVGAIVSGRPPLLAGVEEMIGLFSNAIPVRITANGNVSFRELLKKVQQGSIESMEHHYVQLASIQAASELGRNLFDHILVFENFPVQKMVEKGLKENSSGNQLTLLSAAVFEQSNYDFSLTVVPAETMLFRFSYNGNRYDDNQVDRLKEHLLQMIAGVLENPDANVQQINYLTQEEKVQLLETFNDTRLAYDKHSTVLSLFEEQVQKTPDNIAVVFEDVTLTYRELDHKAALLAHYLKSECAIASDDLVGIMLSRSAQMIIAVLGIWKAGGAYVPIDPDYPVSRQEFIINDTAIKSLITQTDYIFNVSGYNGNVFAIDIQLDLQLTAAAPDAGISPASLAYVIYTSGSTGQPKGVMIEHGAIVNTIFAQRKLFQLKEHNAGLQFASLSFDASVWEMFMLLVTGGSLHIISDERKRSPEQLVAYIADHHIDIATLPPAFFRLLPTAALKSLKQLITAGEAAVFEKAAAFAEEGIFYNAYGPTESSVCATVYQYKKGDEIISGNMPIGSPIANTFIYIVDDHLNLMPQGMVGEICIGGAGLARGYLNQPLLTAEKFVANPFRKAERIYKTGDLGRWLPDGNIEFAGRKDNQVKIRGYRIELDEIENALQSLEEVTAAAVLNRTTATGENELVAYFSSRQPLYAADIRSQLVSLLPAYMIPAHFVYLETLPLNANGKIDRKKLPHAEGLALESGAGFVAPRNELEQLLAGIYEEVLQKSQVSIKDDFFALGGDSIKSIQIVSRLKQKGYVLTIQDVLQYPVIESLVARVNTSSRMADQGLVEGLVPLSPIQSWFFEQPFPTHHHYNQSVLLQHAGAISEEGLRAVLNKLVLHHDALRMVYTPAPDGWIQENKGLAQGYQLEVIEYTTEHAFIDHCNRIQSGFDLEKGGLFKAALFRHATGDRLLLVAHHLVVDGVSWRIIFEDLSTLYEQYLSGNVLSLPLKTDAFKYWMKKQQEYAGSELLLQEDVYWSAIASRPVKVLPMDHPGGSNLAGDAASAKVVLDTTFTERLLKTCYAKYQTEINDILLAALALAVGEEFGLEEVLLKMEGHGREDIGEEVDVTRTVGWFTATYPVLLRIQPADSIRHLLAVKETLQAVPRKGIGYGILRYMAGKDYRIEPAITFNYLGDFGNGVNTAAGHRLFEFSGAHHGRENTIDTPRDAALDIAGMVVDGNLHLSVKYSNKQFSPAKIEKLLSSFRQYLEAYTLQLSSAGSHNEAAEHMLYNVSYNQLFYMSGWEITSPVVVSKLEFAHIDSHVLQQAIEQLIDRQESLRTVFINDKGHIRQRVLPAAMVNFQLPITPLANENELNAIIEEEYFRKFDLSEAPLFRVRLFKIDNGSYHLLLTMHHIITDGYSRGVLQSELQHLYSMVAGKNTVPLKPLAFQYRDFVAWQQKFLHSVTGQQHRSYWLKRLEGSTLETKFPDTTASHGDAYSIQMTGVIADKLFENLDQFARNNNLTRAGLLMSVLTLLLHQLNQEDDIVIGTAISGREAEHFGDLDIRELIGYFVNALMVRNTIAGEMTVLQHAQQVQQNFLQDLNYAAYPFTKLVQELPAASISARLLDNIVFFNYHNYDHLKTAVYKSQVDELSAAVETKMPVKGNFGMTVTGYHNCLRLEFMFNPSLFDRARRIAVRDHYFSLLQQLLHHPGLLVSQIKPVHQQQSTADLLNN